MSAEILMSNLNVNKLDAIVRGSEWFGDFVDRATYDGIELTPMRGGMLREAKLGKLTMSAVIRSMHQSFVTDIRHVPFSIVMPQMDASLDDLAHIQSYIRTRSVPVVVYPNEQMPPRTAVGSTHFADPKLPGEKLWQVTSEVLDAWKIPISDTHLALDALTHRMKQERLDGCVIDTHHSYAQRGGVVPNWEEWLPAMDQQRLVREVHVSPARSDMGGGNEELRAILGGNIAETRTGAVLSMTHPDRIVTEIPANEIGQLGYRDIVAVHRDIVSAIKDHIA